jgi:hypothetical protein
LLDKIVLQQCEIKTLVNNQVKIQPKTPDADRAIIKALAKKKTHPSIPSNLKKNVPKG